MGRDDYEESDAQVFWELFSNPDSPLYGDPQTARNLVNSTYPDPEDEYEEEEENF